MKGRFFTTAMLAVLSATFTWAQSSIPLQANIPFSFRVGVSLLPAGQYVIQPVSMYAPVLRIGTLDGKQAIMTLVNGVTRPNRQKEGKLVFNRYGNTYFLSQIWQPGHSGGRQLPKSVAEREIAQANQPAAVRVTVAALH